MRRSPRRYLAALVALTALLAANPAVPCFLRCHQAASPASHGAHHEPGAPAPCHGGSVQMPDVVMPQAFRAGLPAAAILVSADPAAHIPLDEHRAVPLSHVALLDPPPPRV